MNIFETVKAAVTLRQAADHYGLKTNRSGMVCCPFHDDRHPSMKLNEDYFYCFGCGATGDVVDFTARLLGLSAYEAAQRLATDFGLDTSRPPVVAQVTIMQVSRSKKWESKPVLDGNGNPMLNTKGKKILKSSYSVLQDDFFNFMQAAGYTDVERGERGSTEEHLTVTQFKVQAETQRLEAVTAQADTMTAASRLKQVQNEEEPVNLDAFNNNYQASIEQSLPKVELSPIEELFNGKENEISGKVLLDIVSHITESRNSKGILDNISSLDITPLR